MPGRFGIYYTGGINPLQAWHRLGLNSAGFDPSPKALYNGIHLDQCVGIMTSPAAGKKTLSRQPRDEPGTRFGSMAGGPPLLKRGDINRMQGQV
jgi:hypothetical protein